MTDTKYEPQEGKETLRDSWNSIITLQAPTGYNGMLAQLRCPFQHICSKITSWFACERRGGKIDINEGEQPRTSSAFKYVISYKWSRVSDSNRSSSHERAVCSV